MNEQKKVTLRDIASMAGVSIATVSHVINRTRYVSPELVGRIEHIIEETGYGEKLADREHKLKTGRKSTVYGIFPNLDSALYRDMISCLKKHLAKQGYQLYIVVSMEDREEEQSIIHELINNKTTAGILLVPIGSAAADYAALIGSGIPFVCMERIIFDENVDTVVFRDRQALYEATEYLLDIGHKNILYIREARDSTTRYERTKGFLRALEKKKTTINEANIVDVALADTEDNCCMTIRRAIDKLLPTAVIAGGARLTICLLKSLQEMGLDIPSDVSVIGFADDTLSELVSPPLTTLCRDVDGFCSRTVSMLFEKINTGHVILKNNYAEVELKLRSSTRMLDNGPFGEASASPDDIVLTKDEVKRLRSGKYRVAISFHYTGTAWAELHEKGINDELSRYGIEVVSMMDAHFDPELQNVQLDAIRIQRPDAVIAVPTDDKYTAEKFQELSAVTKLVFISNVPEKMQKNNYVSCISVNEWENGSNAGRLMGEYYRKKTGVKAGLIIHGAIFYGTRARDSAAEKMVADNYPNIEIASRRSFGKIENAYQVCRDMLEDNPEIETLYVSWDQPALQVIKALREMGREDVTVFTTDLDYEIAMCMEEGIVKGLSTQRPYEQGRAAALTVAKSLVCDDIPKYIGVQPYIVNGKQLSHDWKYIFHESVPGPLGRTRGIEEEE